jgi:hypothetical protein
MSCSAQFVPVGDAGNDANYCDGSYTDPTNCLTPVGAFSALPGPYVAYDRRQSLVLILLCKMPERVLRTRLTLQCPLL